MDDLQEIMKKMVPGVQDIFGNALEQIILYGSVARGIHTDESDVLPFYQNVKKDGIMLWSAA